MREKRKTKVFWGNKQGGVLVTFVLALFLIMLCVGIVVDYAGSYRMKTKMVAAMDAALVSSGAEIVSDVDLNNGNVVKNKLRTVFENFFSVNMPGNAQYQSRNNLAISYDANIHEVSISLGYDYKTFFLQLINQDKIYVKVNASAKLVKAQSGEALSIVLVLDRSGSMESSGRSNGPKKIASLRNAVQDMNTSFDQVDPQRKYIRAGAVYFSDSRNSELIEWGAQHIAQSQYLLANPRGGTKVNQGVEKALSLLLNPREKIEHRQRNGLLPKKMIVMMTDGKNEINGTYAPTLDYDTKNKCTQAKNSNIEIFAIAFYAPVEGQNLMKACATDAAHYFEIYSGRQLREVFKEIGKGIRGEVLISQ